jgi:allophanate hydrolase
VFALSSVDADLVRRVLLPHGPETIFERDFRFGVPKPLEFFGDTAYAMLNANAIETLKAMGGTAVEIDYAPFAEAAQLLYAGPWVAERTAAVGDFIEKAGPEAGVWPVTRDIVLSGRKYSAVDAFEGQYKLDALRARAEMDLAEVNFLALPTAGTIHTVADLDREPVRFNSNLGHYTNFVNFFELCGLALPFGFRPDGMPFGITLIAHPYHDQGLLEFGARWQRKVPLPLGKTSSALPPVEADPKVVERRDSIAVVGAHMSGLPLNRELTELGGRLERAAKTAPHYRLYALPGGPPHRPGLLRVADGGGEIELEVWSLPIGALGHFVSAIPAPLGIGTIALADGTTVQGFVCESYATTGARNITSFGGWRAYLKSLS